MRERLWIATLFTLMVTGIASAHDSIFTGALIVCAVAFNNALMDKHEAKR